MQSDTMTDPVTSGQPGASGSRPASGILLYFEAGKRPGAEAIERLLAGADAAMVTARIAHRPDPGEGWVELLSSGLTFDLSGLDPAAAIAVAEPEHRFGFGDDMPDLMGCEALLLEPGPHIAGGAAMLPVVRTMVGLAANLSLGLPVVALAWGPTGTVMEPRYYARLAMNWLGGGAFPILGLGALVHNPDGSVASRGLAFFTGQELQVAPAPGASRADTAKIALRVADYIVREGAIRETQDLQAGGEVLLAEPTQQGRLLWVSHKG